MGSDPIVSPIVNNVIAPWVVSYDDVAEVRKIYSGLPVKSFSLSYSLANNGKGREVMFFKEDSLVPTREEILSLGLNRIFDDR